MTNIVVPALGESVTEATIANWLKKEGDTVNRDDPLLELETDKVTLEINAPVSGVLSVIKAKDGATVQVGEIVGEISEGAGTSVTSAPVVNIEKVMPQEVSAPPRQTGLFSAEAVPSPAARKIATEVGVDLNNITGTGKDGRVTKADVLSAVPTSGATPATPSAPSLTPSAPSVAKQPVSQPPQEVSAGFHRQEQRERMSRLRQRIAERLKASQNTAAILTTFNEIDMTNVIDLRNSMKDRFEKKYGARLGFMSFFVKAAVEALKDFPAVNAEIDGQDIVYKNYYDIGVAVGTPQGLVVPVVRDADRKSFADIEKEIARLADRARDGHLTMEEMSGGTFTISNGGVYGSLLATPIINPPQSGILGMHKMEKRPIVVDDAIVIRQMMYVALSYDHRIIDGKESVGFLVRIKECIENPERMLLNV